MLTYQYGGKRGKKHKLAPSRNLVAVRTHSRRTVEDCPLSAGAREVLGRFRRVAHFPVAGVEILEAAVATKAEAARDQARAILGQERDVRFAGRVLHEPRSRVPALYTENLFVKFEDHRSTSACKKILQAHGVSVKRELTYARNAFFVGAPEGCGTEVFDLAGRLLAEQAVELCHPELVRQVRRLEAFAPQWHLKATRISGRRIDAHAHVEEAWELSRGDEVVIAVIDDGVDIAHEELDRPGKIVAPRDATLETGDPRPGAGANHGTACAGVACAAGAHGASGVAPGARLMPIRLVSGLGSQAEAEAFIWAARNGADVISCSWGPVDGDWWDDQDPRHHSVVPLPDSTRLAIDWAVDNGRNGRGCIITWAAGNGNESVDNDGYASYPRVIAVAACNDEGTKSLYSDIGDAIWCSFPSSDFRPTTRTPGIWTTDRSGHDGYNPGQGSKGDAAGNYTNSFGGTSSACPGVAGVAALVLARNPELRWEEVKEILKRSCDRIDEAGGGYGADGHSSLYGFGRVNAKKAVEVAAPSLEGYVAVHTAIQQVAIKDLATSRLAVEVGDTAAVRSIKIAVDIRHTYRGDLVVRLLPPAGTGVGAVTLHNRAGGSIDDLIQTYDPAGTPALAALVGKSPRGTWTLEVEDRARQDTGEIRQFSVEIGR